MLVYATDVDAGAKYQRAREVLRAAKFGRLCFPLQAVGESFAVLTRRHGWAAAEAREVLETFMRVIPVLAATAASVMTAMRLYERHGVSFWDAQIVAAAAAGGCTALLSEDLQDGRRFDARDLGRSLRIVNPFDDVNVPLLETSDC